ncbi:MAG TPA: anaerobic ribonucleoside-triphosphate reductase activating protein [Methanobacteriaceae archaeon]|nr:anaerobic ribonucleoside-triphosphate reductase activating protein [Methanobacteriaceae archaeon]
MSSLEYPGKVSLVVFTGGCLLRCPYCHNPEIITGGEEVSLDKIKADIKKTRDFLDALVITGGEPLMQCEDVEDLLKFAKSQGLLTKLDTNGCFPGKLSKITELLDYVALDIKAPFEDYLSVIGSDIGHKVELSMKICAESTSFLECRTTYVPGLLKPDDIINIAQNISCDLYTIQQFRNRIVLDEKLHKTPNPSRDELYEIAQTVKPLLGEVKIKTAEFGEELI